MRYVDVQVSANPDRPVVRRELVRLEGDFLAWYGWLGRRSGLSRPRCRRRWAINSTPICIPARRVRSARGGRSVRGEPRTDARALAGRGADAAANDGPRFTVWVIRRPRPTPCRRRGLRRRSTRESWGRVGIGCCTSPAWSSLFRTGIHPDKGIHDFDQLTSSAYVVGRPEATTSDPRGSRRGSHPVPRTPQLAALN